MNILIYILQVIFYTGIFWGIYRLFLMRNTRHAFSRLFLWLSVLLPLGLPFIRWPGAAGNQENGPVTISLPEMVTTSASQIDNSFHGNIAIVMGLYTLVVLLLAVRLVLKHVRIRKVLRQHDYLVDQGLRIYTGTGIGPGSYGRAVFLPEHHLDEKIVAHEAAHIRQGHYYDLLILQLVKTICWPNIFLYAIGKDLQLVHEYQADAVACGDNTHEYVLRLLDEIFGSRQYSVTHSFFHHPIKNRISMLQQTKKTLRNTGKMMLALGMSVMIVATTVWTQSCNFKKSSSDEFKKNAPGEAAQKQKVFTYVSTMPEFNGDLFQWLGKNIRYPEVAQKKGQQGRVGVTFAVKDDGHVADAVISKTSGIKELDEEALRVVNSMPAWKPGKNNGETVCVAYTLPITFKLDL